TQWPYPSTCDGACPTPATSARRRAAGRAGGGPPGGGDGGGGGRRGAAKWRLKILSAHSPPLFPPPQAQNARPLVSALSCSDSHGISSVNMVTHCRQEHGIFVMSVPQNSRCGPKAS